MRPEFSPTKSPRLYRQEFLKSALTLIELAPLIERGLINLFPDPGYFDRHLQSEMTSMATSRLGSAIRKICPDDRELWAYTQDMKRAMLYNMPEEAKVARIRKQMPDSQPTALKR